MEYLLLSNHCKYLLLSGSWWWLGGFFFKPFGPVEKQILYLKLRTEERFEA